MLACTGSVETTTAPSTGKPAPAHSAEPTIIVEVPPTADALAVDSTTVWPLHAGRVLLSTAAAPAWATGPVLVLDGNRYHEKWQIERAADLDALQPELRELAGATVDLYGPRGRVCTVVIDTLTIEAHLSMLYIDGKYDEPGGAALWEALGNDEDYEAAVLLVGDFAAPLAGSTQNTSCAEALWARDASLPAPAVLALGDPRDHATLVADERRRALESDAGKKFIHDYQTYAADPEHAQDAEPWSSVSEGDLQVWVDPSGAAQFVALSFGDFRFSPCHWRGPGHAYLRQVGEDEMPFGPSPLPAAVFDADLDGRYELLIVHKWGDFELIHVLSSTRALKVELSLPDRSWVWC
jgi:hypothetical protein